MSQAAYIRTRYLETCVRLGWQMSAVHKYKSVTKLHIEQAVCNKQNDRALSLSLSLVSGNPQRGSPIGEQEGNG